jgi:hypothetical protein
MGAYPCEWNIPEVIQNIPFTGSFERYCEWVWDRASRSLGRLKEVANGDGQNGRLLGRSNSIENGHETELLVPCWQLNGTFGLVLSTCPKRHVRTGA